MDGLTCWMVKEILEVGSRLKRNTLGTHYLSQYFFFRYVGHNAEAGGLSVHHLQ